MEKTISEKVVELRNYYKEDGLSLIGLNDSQGVITTGAIFKNSLLKELGAILRNEDLDPVIFDAFSLLLNKTEHVDYMIMNNLSLEDVKLSQIYSARTSIEKVERDILNSLGINIKLPNFIKNIGMIYKLAYPIQEEDSKLFIGDMLRDSKEPTVIYSSGPNNLMREMANNPFAISKDYRKKDETPNYYYSLEKAKDKRTLEDVLLEIKSNFDTMLSLNNNTDIYALGAYVPKSLEKEELKIFKDVLEEYNEKLRTLCRNYRLTFIDTRNIGNNFNKSEANFHLNPEGHRHLAHSIIDSMHKRKIVDKTTPIAITPNFYDLPSRESNIEGMINNISLDQIITVIRSEELSGYPKEVQMNIVSEHEREMDVLKKVLEKRSK